MLDWSMLDLARAAGVSISTIKRAEGSLQQPVSGHVITVIRDALERVGAVFLADDGDGPGVRLRAMNR